MVGVFFAASMAVLFGGLAIWAGRPAITTYEQRITTFGLGLISGAIIPSCIALSHLT